VVALTNPANDAAAVTEMFRKASFDVVESRRDLKNTEMRRALRDFTEKAHDADIAVIYYAGHGIEVDGTNYLIPVDAVLERDTDAYDEAIALDRILQAIEPAKQLRLVILDACRDNPFAKNMKRTVASRALSRGLAGVEPARPNTLIAFAAKGGSTAADGDSNNSPFTTALLKYLAKPGLELGKAFRLVRDDVMNATGNRQEPFVYGSLGGNDVAMVPAPAAPPPAGGNANAEIRRDYELAERVGTKEAWDSFVAANRSGFYTDLAKAQLNKLAAESARIAASEGEARLAAEGAKHIVPEKARLETEKTKKLEETKIASVEQATPKTDKPNAGPPTGSAVASRPPAGQAVPEVAKSDGPAPQDIPRLLQSELRRVGCQTGEIDGEWSASGRRALSSFNDNAGTKFDVRLASLDALDAVRSKAGRICPLICDHGYKAVGEKCVEIVCKAGFQVGDESICERVRARKPITNRQKPARIVEPESKPTQSASQNGKQSFEALYAQCRAEGRRIAGRHRNVGFSRIEACARNGGRM
ncbi:MAG TPA: caspase family protein, partial [Gemmataceae bacterium]|nr:caspase family protein [Gemmataceae bacterium]